jgi:hypothetical protein
MMRALPPFNVMITEEAAAAFARSAALDPANPPSGVPLTYPFTWFASPSILLAVSAEDGAVPVLIAINIRDAKPLQPLVEYRVEATMQAEIAAGDERMRAGLAISDVSGQALGHFEAVFQMVALSREAAL